MGMLAWTSALWVLRWLLLLGAHPESGWNLLHVLVADSTLLLLLLALLEQLLQMLVHLIRMLVVWLLLLLLLLRWLWLLLLLWERLMRSENRIATSALELLHLLLEVHVGAEWHLRHLRRMRRLLWWLLLWGSIST